MTRLRGRSEHVCKVSVVTIGGGGLLSVMKMMT